MKNEFKTLWKQYEPFIKAVVELFHPFVEATVHDLNQGTIAAIYHNFSQRKVGDSSPLRELGIDTSKFPDYFDPYHKKNKDGRLLKCTSITIRNSKKQAVGLICFNVDMSFAQESHKILETFLKIKTDAASPIEQFGKNCEEQIHLSIQNYLTDNNLSLNHLNKKQKQELVQYLYQQGTFHFKNSIPFLAQLLHISRTSVYNYIKLLGAHS